MSTETSNPYSEMLSKIPKKCGGPETEFERAQLPALLCKHAAEQTAEGGDFLGKTDSE